MQPNHINKDALNASIQKLVDVNSQLHDCINGIPGPRIQDVLEALSASIISVAQGSNGLVNQVNAEIERLKQANEEVKLEVLKAQREKKMLRSDGNLPEGWWE